MKTAGGGSSRCSMGALDDGGSRARRAAALGSAARGHARDVGRRSDPGRGRFPMAIRRPPIPRPGPRRRRRRAAVRRQGSRGAWPSPTTPACLSGPLHPALVFVTRVRRARRHRAARPAPRARRTTGRPPAAVRRELSHARRRSAASRRSRATTPSGSRRWSGAGATGPRPSAPGSRSSRGSSRDGPPRARRRLRSPARPRALLHPVGVDRRATAIAAALDDPAFSWTPARDTARTPPRP